jgi:hypothetical protein
MRNTSNMTLDRVLVLARQLSPVDQARLVARLAPIVVQALDQTGRPAIPAPRAPLRGLLADLGPAPSAEDIAEARRAMWGVPENNTDSNRQPERVEEGRVAELSAELLSSADRTELEAAIQRIILEIDRGMERMMQIQQRTERLGEETRAVLAELRTSCGELAEAPGVVASGDVDGDG